MDGCASDVSRASSVARCGRESHVWCVGSGGGFYVGPSPFEDGLAAALSFTIAATDGVKKTKKPSAFSIEWDGRWK